MSNIQSCTLVYHSIFGLINIHEVGLINIHEVDDEILNIRTLHMSLHVYDTHNWAALFFIMYSWKPSSHTHTHPRHITTHNTITVIDSSVTESVCVSYQYVIFL